MSASVLDRALDLGSSPFHVKEVLVASSGLLYTYSLELVIRKIDPVPKGQYIWKNRWSSQRSHAKSDKLERSNQYKTSEREHFQGTLANSSLPFSEQLWKLLYEFWGRIPEYRKTEIFRNRCIMEQIILDIHSLPLTQEGSTSFLFPLSSHCISSFMPFPPKLKTSSNNAFPCYVEHVSQGALGTKMVL